MHHGTGVLQRQLPGAQQLLVSLPCGVHSSLTRVGGPIRRMQQHAACYGACNVPSCSALAGAWEGDVAGFSDDLQPGFSGFLVATVGLEVQGLGSRV